MGDRLVIDAGKQGTDESVGGIRSENELLRTLVAPEVKRYRLAHDLGHRHAAARSPTHQLFVGRLGKAQVGGSVGRHRDIPIPRYTHIAAEIQRAEAKPQAQSLHLPSRPARLFHPRDRDREAMTFTTLHRLPFLSRFAAENLLPGAPERAQLLRRFSTNAHPATLSRPARVEVLRALRQAGRGLAGFLRASGVGRQWRFLLVLALLSFAAAWLGTRAVMAGFESSWTELTLTAAQHESQDLRIRQETLREETAAALAHLAAAEPAAARHP